MGIPSVTSWVAGVADADLHGEFQHFPETANPGARRDHGVIALYTPPVSIDCGNGMTCCRSRVLSQ